jgi:ectoine hydroxylase-related dioxygenase (phytanoyl-CoA dioxygenase family)
MKPTTDSLVCFDKAGFAIVPNLLEKMVTLRLHLDDCDEDNGALRVIRGSHRDGKLADADLERWKNTGEVIACVVPKGGGLLMRPLLLHTSSPAKRPCHRRVLHIEYAAEPLPFGLSWYEPSSQLTTGH